MSIYATQWQIRIEAPPHWCTINRDFKAWVFKDGKKVPYTERWLLVTCQGVPAHIGRKEDGYETDYYVDFLPPVVLNPEDDFHDGLRAVVIILEGYEEKEGQRYVTPLLVMSGWRYRQTSWVDLLGQITKAVEEMLSNSDNSDV